MSQATPNAYLRTKVLTATPEELRLLLFDGAIRFAEQARRGIETNDHEMAYIGVTRCQAILMELMNSLRPEHDTDLCTKLSALYTFLYTELLHASHEQDLDRMDEVLRLLRYERETWAMLMEHLSNEKHGSQSTGAAPVRQPGDAASLTSRLSLQG